MMSMLVIPVIWREGGESEMSEGRKSVMCNGAAKCGDEECTHYGVHQFGDGPLGESGCKPTKCHEHDLPSVTCREVIACENADKCMQKVCEHRDPHVKDTLTDPCDMECIAAGDAKMAGSNVNCVSIEKTVPAEPDEDALGLAALFDDEEVEEPAHALEHILLTQWEGDTSDLNIIRIAKKEMMYEEVTRWLIAGLNEGCIDDEKYRVQEIIVYDKADLDGWIDKVEKALKKLAEL